MNNNELTQFSEELQTLVVDNFILNRYNTDRDDFQVDQLKKVYLKINQLYVKSPESLDALLSNWNISILPNIETVGGVGHMQNIGTSASMCLVELEKNKDNAIFSDLPVRQYVDMFLKRIRQQAQALLEEFSQSQEVYKEYDIPELRGVLSRELFNPYFEEYNALLIQQRNEFEDIIAATKKDLQQLLNETKEELNKISSTAQLSAEKAEENAKNTETTITEIVSKLDNATGAAQEATDAAKEATDAATSATKSAISAEETSKNMLPNMLSALGIFIGIVIAVVACYLSILLAQHGENVTSISNYSRPFEFVRYLLMGHITLAVVFLLMFLISRISGHSLACSCRHYVSGNPNCTDCDCWVCKNKCSIPVRFKLRYPYLYGINLVCFLGYAILAFWQFINLYYREQVNVWILANRGCAIIVLLIILGILVFILFKTFRFQGEKNKKST